MHSNILVVLALCVAVSILNAVDAAPRRHLGSKNDYDYGRPNKHGHPNKHHHDEHPSNYRRRLEATNSKATESSGYDYGHDDYEHKGYDYDDYDYKGYGGDCGDYDYKGYGYSYDYKSYGSDCNDYGDDYYGHGNDYGFDKGYSYGDYPAYSYGSYGGDYGFYPDYYASYGGVSGYGYPSYSYHPGSGYSGYGFPGYFGYESTADAEAGTNNIDLKTEEGAGKSADKKASKTPSNEAKSKSDAANKSKGK